MQDRHVIVDDFLCTPTSESDPSTTKSLIAGMYRRPSAANLGHGHSHNEPFDRHQSTCDRADVKTQ